ncbi:hypothetical protein TNCV_1845811 [Trichonephila clavipes]|nr:hypothetical protein TNCV_1845811 [Trichonephila clavipes]
MTDGATVMKKVGELIGANKQLYYAHGIQYKQNKEQKNSNTGDTESSVSDFEQSNTDTDNEDNDNVIIEDIDNEVEIFTQQEMLPIINTFRKIALMFKRSSSKMPFYKNIY